MGETKDASKTYDISMKMVRLKKVRNYIQKLLQNQRTICIIYSLGFKVLHLSKYFKIFILSARLIFDNFHKV